MSVDGIYQTLAYSLQKRSFWPFSWQQYWADGLKTFRRRIMSARFFSYPDRAIDKLVTFETAFHGVVPEEGRLLITYSSPFT